ncbi:MAG TPA: phosphate signaling complex protein PhoU [Phycisphaerae bacterium]|nr:phosphate signaling complex protein PhoU [Phycisphaerae bacterium]HPS53809.1 phosphate signaling complex protein PhoU [Phycisphaerae bacterium]
MLELQKKLQSLMLRLDYMGMRVEQQVHDAVESLRKKDADAAKRIIEFDEKVDREEVEIEQECIRLLALYQPAAIDLRTICTIIKVNNDLERIADRAVNLAKQVKHIIASNIDMEDYKGLLPLEETVFDILNRTMRMINTTEVHTAKEVIEMDDMVDSHYKELLQMILSRNESAAKAITANNIAKAFERIADLCTNISEDIIFLRTGEIVRHADI